MRITGTFLDGIPCDIPSANWGPDDWARDFDAMKRIGIDTVIIIRAGYKSRSVYDSPVLKKYVDMQPAYIDMVDVFLNEAERCGMELFFGIYDSARYWYVERNPEKELEINIDFSEEVAKRYGHRKAFRGWYIAHELNAFEPQSFDALIVYEKLAGHLKSLINLPVLMSPFFWGRKFMVPNPSTPEEHYCKWDKMLARLEGLVDILAFQDGGVDFLELPEFLKINSELAKKYSMASWSNVETFERGMPINYLPIDWTNLRYKMEAADGAGIEKLITFEFSHFMSPNSVYPSAHNLYRRYCEWLDEIDG